MNKKFIFKVTILVGLLIAFLYCIIPNINIIMSHIDKENYKRVTIFFTNDTHGRARQNKRNDEMGMALIQSLYIKNAPKNSEVLVLDVGDTIYGTNETDLNAGNPMIEILNTMNCKAMAVGNHEFDYGFDQSMQAFENADFPILSANIYKDGKRVFEPYTILEVGDIKFGVIGLSTEETLTRTKPEYVKDLTVTDSSDELKELLPEVKEQSDFIVVLGHEHTERLRELAQEFSDIDLIIAGHDHEVFKKLEKVGNAYLTSSGIFSHYAGMVDLVFKDKELVHAEGKMLKTKSTNNADKTIAAIVSKYHDQIASKLSVKIGETKTDLGTAADSYYKETNFGNAVTDAMREYMETDVALQNGGGIRNEIPAGDLTLYDINEAFPFVNYVISVEMTGSEIKEALEVGLEKYPSGWNGGFPQVSGMTYTFDAKKPSGERLVSVFVGNEEIQDDKVYTVATNDYLYQGGDGYDVIKNSKLIYNSGMLIKDVFTEYVEKHPIIEFKVEGRAKVINE